MPQPHFAVIADSHLSGEPDDRSSALAWALGDMQRREPDFVLFLGDMTADGEPASYLHLHRLVDLTDLPCHFVRGNNENRGPGDTWFVDFLGKPWHEFEWQSLRLVCLDTTVHPFPAEQRRWLEQCPRDPGERVPVVFAHHCFECLDPAQAERLHRALEACGVRQFLCGHAHVDRLTQVGAVQQRVVTCLDPRKSRRGRAGYYRAVAAGFGIELEFVPLPFPAAAPALAGSAR